jgi:hypothetical protein
MRISGFLLQATVVFGLAYSQTSISQDVEWLLSDSNVGVGTGTPRTRLHVKGDDNVRLLVENSNAQATGDQVLFELSNASAAKVRFAIASNSASSRNVWTFDNTPALDAFSISKVGTGKNEFLLTANGDATFRGRSFAVNHINTSTREAKSDFSMVDVGEILEQMDSLPITQWRYKDESSEVRHIGPVAEDFLKAFNLGDGKSISTVDASGVAFAAIKGLIKRLRDKEIEIDGLKSRLKDQEIRTARLEADLDKLSGH